jgi:hypothetical protein
MTTQKKKLSKRIKALEIVKKITKTKKLDKKIKALKTIKKY